MSSNLETHAMFQTIMDSAQSLLHCDRCSLFLIDHETEEFWSYVTESDGVEFRFPMSKGIIGQVAREESTLNIPDAYDVPSFNAEADAESGYRTKSILCMPVVTVEGHMVAVIEMINKHDDGTRSLVEFNASDEDILAKFTSVIAGALSNSLVYNELEQHTSMVESTLQGITSFIITLDNKGKLKSTNHDIEELFGCTESVMRNNSYTSWIKDQPGGAFKDNVKKVYENGEQTSGKNEKLFVQAKSGSSLLVNYQIMALKVDSRKKRYTRRNSSLMSAAKNTASTMADVFETPPGSPGGGACSSGFSSRTLGSPSSPGRTTPLSPSASSGTAERRRSSLSVGVEENSDPGESEIEGVVIVLENITEGRLRQSAIERYQRRLNEMESQVKEFSSLKDKLQELEIDDLKDINPETSRALANIALCLNVPAHSTSGLNSNRLELRSSFHSIGNEAELLGGTKGGGLIATGSPSTRGFLMEYRSVLSSKALKNFNWNVLDIESEEVLKKAVCVMFDEVRWWCFLGRAFVDFIYSASSLPLL